ncbi:hypothetical protein BC832DRAFT_537591 [Gaertneriomyces semiglobifer]|nr:hypothetical protein BC832DRAFT_537591 [Gaertneriomyces semiglobifer]
MNCWICGIPWWSQLRDRHAKVVDLSFKEREEFEYRDLDQLWFMNGVMVASDHVTSPGTMSSRWIFWRSVRSGFDLDKLLGKGYKVDHNPDYYARSEQGEHEVDRTGGPPYVCNWTDEDDDDERAETFYSVPKPWLNKGPDLLGRRYKDGLPDLGVFWPAHFGCLMLVAAWTGNLACPQDIFKRDGWTLLAHRQKLPADRETVWLDDLPTEREELPTRLLDYGPLQHHDVIYYPEHRDDKKWGTSIFRSREFVEGKGYKQTRYMYHYYEQLGLGSLAFLPDDLLSDILAYVASSSEGFAPLMRTSSKLYAFFGGAPKGTDPHASPLAQTLYRTRCEYLGLVPTKVDLKRTANNFRKIVAAGPIDWIRYYSDCSKSEHMRNRARIRRMVRRIVEMMDSFEEA